MRVTWLRSAVNDDVDVPRLNDVRVKRRSRRADRRRARDRQLSDRPSGGSYVLLPLERGGWESCPTTSLRPARRSNGRVLPVILGTPRANLCQINSSQRVRPYDSCLGRVNLLLRSVEGDERGPPVELPKIRRSTRGPSPRSSGNPLPRHKLETSHTGHIRCP